LRSADLQSADLRSADLDFYQICPEEGGFHAFKKTTLGVCKIYIPADAKRINAIGSRKCRASKIKVISGDGCGGQSPTHTKKIIYEKGATYECEDFCDDARSECAPGIHFFITKQEAENWNTR
jgi:hypothetical protein